MSRHKKGNPYIYVPLSRESEIKCNTSKCLSGGNLISNGHCFLKGNPYVENCPEFLNKEGKE